MYSIGQIHVVGRAYAVQKTHAIDLVGAIGMMRVDWIIYAVD